uniref:Uncharacterized protein n=1 Tax=Glossina austeni TaxID=7395 RepID=A0A1A9UDS1_GLOAU
MVPRPQATEAAMAMQLQHLLMAMVPRRRQVLRMVPRPQATEAATGAATAMQLQHPLMAMVPLRRQVLRMVPRPQATEAATEAVMAILPVQYLKLYLKAIPPMAVIRINLIMKFVLNSHYIPIKSKTAFHLHVF